MTEPECQSCDRPVDHRFVVWTADEYGGCYTCRKCIEEAWARVENGEHANPHFDKSGRLKEWS